MAATTAAAATTKKRKNISKPLKATTSYNYKNLDEWLENSVKGIQLEQSTESPSTFNSQSSPFALGPIGPWRRSADPWMLPPELNYLNLPGYSSPLQHHPLLHFMGGGSGNGNAHNHHEFASLPPVLTTSTATFGSMNNNNTNGNIGGNNNDKAALNTDTANQNRM